MYRAASSLSGRRRPASAALALSGLVVALVLGTLVSTTPAARAIGSSAVIDAPAPYDGQVTCAHEPEPGTVALAGWLMSTYPATGSMGMMRACGAGGRSEHKDGRAFDWAADVRRKAQRRAAYDFIHKALATDEAGNAHALARRMGIMYLIYDDTIWSSYRDFAPRPYLNSGCKQRKKCSRTLRHLNHVHISLGLAGAAAQTSWYRDRNVPSHPVLHQGTNELDADATAVTGLDVPATGASVASAFLLRAGVTYRLVATGTVGTDQTGGVGDPNCVAGVEGDTLAPRGPLTAPVTGWTGPFSGWGHREGSVHPASPYALPVAETRGLLVAGALRWEGECQADHTYETWFTPATTQPLQLQYADATPADDTGTLTVYVARDDIARSSLKR